MSVLAVLATLALMLASASGAAAAGFAPLGPFGEVAQPSFTKPLALAVDPASGDLLVIDAEAKTISRFAPDGTPDNFSALGTNVIDGVGALPCTLPSPECDGTPQNGLSFGFSNPRELQIAVAPPGAGAGTAGNIYVTQPRNSLNLVDVFAASGEYRGQLTASSEGSFGITTGVAVDSAGAVYISDLSNSKIHKFEPTSNAPFAATNSSNFAFESAATLATGADSTSGSIFADKFGSQTTKLNSSTGIEECPVLPGESIALAVNTEDGHLLNATESQVTEYEGTCAAEAEPRPSFNPPGGALRGIAVDGPAGLVYVSRQGNATIEVWEIVRIPAATTLPATPVTSTSAILRGEVNPNGQPLTECFFEWGESAAYGNIVPCQAPDAAEVGEGTSPVQVHAEVELESGTAYHFQLVVGNANTAPGEGVEGGDQSFTTLGPQVRSEEAFEVTATSAQVAALINPNGSATSFFVEYLTEAEYEANPEAARFAGAARSPPLSDRQIPAAVSATGSTAAGSSTITAVSTAAGYLGPGQAITGPGIPANTTIAAVPSATQVVLSNPATATASNVALTATGRQPVSQLLTGLQPSTPYRFRLVAENEDAQTFGAGGGFATFALPEVLPCPNAATRQGLSSFLPDCRAYEMVSPARKAGEVFPPEPEGVLGGSCRECLPGINYRSMPMQSAPDGSVVTYVGQPFLASLFSGANENLAARGGGWSWQSLNPASVTGIWQAFSADLSRAVLAQSEPPLSPAAPTRGGKAFANLYLRVGDGPPQPLIAVEPPHRDPASGNVINLNLFRVRFATANEGTPLTAPFTHVAFEANDALTAATAFAPAAPLITPASTKECSVEACDLYEWAGGQLRLVNVLPGNAAAGGQAAIGGGRLLGGDPALEAPNVDNAVSADGSRIFWTSGETGRLYVRLGGTQTLEVPSPPTCKESVAKASRACFLAAAADGSAVLLSNGQIYELNGAGTAYEASADLSEGEGGFKGILGAAQNFSRIFFVDSADLTGAEENENEEEAKVGALNLYAWAEGTTTFIGALTAEDNALGTNSRYGAWHASPSDRTAQASPDGRFLAFMSTAPLTGYDNRRAGGGPSSIEVFEYAAESGRLSCASCNPSGQRPLGRSNLTLPRSGEETAALPQPANLVPEGKGRLFFESQDAIVPQDANGSVQDVYEWEPQGVGDCANAGGCVRLISSGTAANDSMFMSSSASGDDAFLVTRQRLVGSDQDSQLDLYDARVGGGFAQATSPSCAGEGCRAPLSEPPTQPSAGSSSYSGPGNPKPQTHKKKKAHHKQKKAHHKQKKAHHKQKKAHHKRKAKKRRQAKKHRAAKTRRGGRR